MEKNQADEHWKTWKVPVPVAYKGEINLQAALLLLFTWDPDRQELLDQRNNISYSAAARALGCTRYKLVQLIEVFRESGMEGVRRKNIVVKKNTRVLNITQAQLEEIVSRETLTRHSTYTLLERVAIYNDKWRA